MAETAWILQGMCHFLCGPGVMGGYSTADFKCYFGLHCE